MAFPDLDSPCGDFEQDALFSSQQAHRVWDFVLALLERSVPSLELEEAPLDRQVATLLLHCDAGYSRSPAVAAAIAKCLFGDDSDFFRRYRPNMRVYRTLLEAWFERSDGQHVRDE